MLISIVTPSYNSSEFISQTIESVLRQTHPNWEMIIVDDCSNDDSYSVVKSFSDTRIKVFRNEKNSGVAFSRNIGLEKVKGEYVCFLDSDDYWDPNKLEIQIEAIRKNPELAILTSSYQKVNIESKFIGKAIKVPQFVQYNDLLKTNSVPCLTVMFSAEIAKKYRFKKIGHEDYVFWLNVLKDGYCVNGLNEVLAYYRVGNSSLSSNKFKAASFQWNIYRKELGFKGIRSLYYFLYYFIFAFKKHII